MANAADRLNQLQQYLNYYRTGGSGEGNGSNAFGYGFGNPGYRNFNSFDPNVNPYAQNNAANAWAQGMMDKQDAQQKLEDQDSIFKNMYSGQNGNSGQMAYVQPQNQQQTNPYAARATQLNNDPYEGSGGGQDISNSLAAMLKPKNYRVG